MSNKAEEFDQLAREVFAPVYPVIAEQFLEKSGISKGLCLDLGCGSGYLGLARPLFSSRLPSTQPTIVP